MMKREFRVRSRVEFQQLYENGRSFANRAAVVYVLPGGAGITRVGFAAGRRLGKAVVRNRLKRRLREAVRHLWPGLRPGVRLLFIARAGAMEMSVSEVEGRVKELLKKARAWVGNGGAKVKRGPEAASERSFRASTDEGGSDA